MPPLTPSWAPCRRPRRRRCGSERDRDRRSVRRTVACSRADRGLPGHERRRDVRRGAAEQRLVSRRCDVEIHEREARRLHPGQPAVGGDGRDVARRRRQEHVAGAVDRRLRWPGGWRPPLSALAGDHLRVAVVRVDGQRQRRPTTLLPTSPTSRRPLASNVANRGAVPAHRHLQPAPGRRRWLVHDGAQGRLRHGAQQRRPVAAPRRRLRGDAAPSNIARSGRWSASLAFGREPAGGGLLSVLRRLSLRGAGVDRHHERHDGEHGEQDAEGDDNRSPQGATSPIFALSSSRGRPWIGAAMSATARRKPAWRSDSDRASAQRRSTRSGSTYRHRGARPVVRRCRPDRIGAARDPTPTYRRPRPGSGPRSHGPATSAAPRR